MERCTKCQGNNFIKRGKSGVIPTTEYVLCSCGNVMVKDSRISMLIPTPEIDTDLTRFMIADAAQALGMPIGSAVIDEEGMAKRFEESISNIVNSLFEDEDDEDIDDCDGCCHDCESYDDCYDEEDEEDEEDIVDEFLEFAEKVLNSTNDPLLKAIWTSMDKEEIKEMISICEKESGMTVSEIMNIIQHLIETMPVSASEDIKEDILANIIGKETKPTDADFKEILDTLNHAFSSENINPTPVEEKEETPKLDLEERELERKSYAVLEKEAGWKIFKDKTKEEISEIINNDLDVNEFLLFEIKPVKVATQSKFTVV